MFKTRTMAAEACRGGRVKLGEKPLKPAFAVKEGDAVAVQKFGLTRTLKVVKPIGQRVSAKLAADCYEDLTPEDEVEEWRLRRRSEISEGREKGEGRPTKKDRRELDRFFG